LREPAEDVLDQIICLDRVAKHRRQHRLRLAAIQAKQPLQRRRLATLGALDQPRGLRILSRDPRCVRGPARPLLFHVAALSFSSDTPALRFV
jgi:hypothetical protein